MPQVKIDRLKGLKCWVVTWPRMENSSATKGLTVLVIETGYFEFTIVDGTRETTYQGDMKLVWSNSGHAE